MSSTYDITPDHASRLMAYLDDVRKHLQWHERQHPKSRPYIQDLVGTTELRIALLQAILVRQADGSPS